MSKDNMTINIMENIIKLMQKVIVYLFHKNEIKNKIMVTWLLAIKMLSFIIYFSHQRIDYIWLITQIYAYNMKLNILEVDTFIHLWQ